MRRKKCEAVTRLDGLRGWWGFEVCGAGGGNIPPTPVSAGQV